MTDDADDQVRPSRRTLLGALATAGLASIAGCTDSTPDRTPTYAPSPEPTRTFTPTATEVPAIGLGETVELDQGETTVDVTVRDYRLTDSYETASGSTVDAPSGEQHLFVELEVVNTGGSDSATPAVGVKPTTGESERPDETASWMESGWFGSGTCVMVCPLPADATERGWIYRRVGADVAAADVRIGISPDVLLTEDEYDWRLV